MNTRRSTTRSGLFATLGGLSRRHRGVGGSLAVLASMALIISMTTAGAYADDQPGDQPSAPASQPASADDTAAPESPGESESSAPAPTDAPSPSGTDDDAGDSAPADEPTPVQPSWTATPLNGLGGLVTAQSQQNGVTDVTITKRTFRSSNDKVVGARFELRPYSNNQTNPPAGGSVGSCTITSGITCTISVSDTGNGGDNNRRFWVVETTAPAGTSAVAKIGTGNASAVTEANPYPGVTPVLGYIRNNSDYSVSMPADGYQLTNSSGSNLEQSDSAGFVANRLDNVAPNVQCNANLNIALVLDKSGSIYGYGGNDYRTSYKNGVGQLLDTLGTSPNTRVAAFTFGTSASKLVSLGTPSSVRSTIVNDIGGTNYTNGTNWDAGLRLVDGDSADYDVVIFVTDGAPNYYYNSSLRNVEFSPTEHAILSANALKDDGVQMVAVGVGAINSNPAGTHNLDAISGPVNGQSQTYIGDWDELGEQLAGIANDLTCRGSITVKKNTEASNGTVSTDVAGWTFKATNTAAPGGRSPAAGSSSKTTKNATWSYQFDNKTDAVDVTIDETAQSGWSMSGVQCTGGTASAINLGNGTFKVTGVKSGSNVVCTVTNSQAKGTLKIEKRDLDTNALVSGATFKVTPNPATGTGSTTITEGSGGDAADGTYTFASALAGSYTVEETAAPDGYLLPPTADRTKTTAVASGQTATLTFKDPRKWKNLSLDVTAAGTYNATYHWSIAKGVRDGSAGGYGPTAEAGDASGSHSFGYQVEVTQGAKSVSAKQLGGTITVGNTNPSAVQVSFALTPPAGYSQCTVTGGNGNRSVAIGGSTFAYTCDPVSATAEPSGGTVGVTMTWSKADYPQSQADVDAGAGSHQKTDSATPAYTVSETDKTVTLTDDKFGTLISGPALPATITWSAEGAKTTVTYSRTVTGNAGTCVEDVNTATIASNDSAFTASASATAKLCVGADLTVTKGAAGSFTRTYLWNIRKVACDADTSALVDVCAASEAIATPQLGSPANPKYTVEVTPGTPATTGYQMTGTITVANPNDWDVTLTGIQDDYLGSTGETCTITTPTPWKVPADGSADFAYECTFAQASPPSLNGVNQATVTWDKAAARTPSGTATGTHTLDPDAEWTETPVNKTVHVYDVLTGGTPAYLGSVTWKADLGPTYFHPTHDNLTAPVGQCRDYTDTAWLAGSASPTAPVLGSDDATVKVCASHYTLDKEVSPSGTVMPGTTLTYTLTVRNDSQAVQKGFSVTDDLTDVLGSVVETAPANLNASVGTPSFTSPTLTWTSTADLAPQTEATLTYTVTVKDDAWKATLHNAATPGPDGDCVQAGECETTTYTPHYTVEKSSDKGLTVAPGEAITYTLRVTNDSQGTVPGFSVTDDLSDVVDNASAPVVATPHEGTATYDASTPGAEKLTWTSTTPLAKGDHVELTYTVTVKADAWKATLKNAVTPGDGGDCAPGKCETTSHTPHYTVEKSSDKGLTVAPGEAITYTLRVTNDSQGTVPGFSVTDDLSDVVDNASAPVVATPHEGTATYDASTPGAEKLTWTSTTPLAKGDHVELTYTVTVKADAWKATLKNAVTPGDGGDCVPGKCETTSHTPHYTLAKSSVPATGSTVMPGDEITYQLTVKNDSEAVQKGFSVTDDLSGVLGSVVETEPTIVGASVGTTSFASPTLTWTSTADLAPQAEATLTYKVTVKDGAWDATLTNVASPGTGGECVTQGGCTTTQETPPVTTIWVYKHDAETQDLLKGAEFELYEDKAPVGTLGAEDELIGTKTTGDTGVVEFGEILAGDYLVKETKAPQGYLLPDEPVQVVTVTSRDMGSQVGVPVRFYDQPTGQVGDLVKAQYRQVAAPTEENPGGEWQQMQADDQVAFGDQVKYTLTVPFTGPRLFHGVTLTDYVPGWDPADTQTTNKAVFVPGSASCGDDAEICQASYDDETHLVTWRFDDPVDAGLGTKTITVSFAVTFPTLPANPSYDSQGFYRDLVWNVGYLDWQEGSVQPELFRIVPRLGAAAALVDQSRVSNQVTTRATAVAPKPPVVNPPVVKPPTVKPPAVKPPKGLPSTGGPASLWLYGGAGLVLLGGVLLLSRRLRRTR